MDRYVIYLRKSRVDEEAEARGEGETLSRHKDTLLELAKKLKLNVVDIYQEVVSGDSIWARPYMQRLLSEVSQGTWTGVLVMEIERLARGDTMDQGYVANAFKESGTKIITPMKTYDPNNEMDEEYFEFGLFMSRREYKTTKRRLMNGRIKSAKEGKFVGSIAPYGYKRKKLEHEKGYTLEIVPDEAEIIKTIFNWFVHGEIQKDGSRKRLGLRAIAKKLNSLNIPPTRNDYWVFTTIRDMITNPVYAGIIRYGYRNVKRKYVDNKIVYQYGFKEEGEYVYTTGLHEAIIDKNTFDLAQLYYAEFPTAPVPEKKEIVSPLAGLIKCGLCGRSMVYRRGFNKKPDYLVCHARACKNVGTPYDLVEKRLLSLLEGWLRDYKLKWDCLENENELETNIASLSKSIKSIENEIAMLEKQRNSTYDLLERGIYTTNEFLERSRSITERLAAAADAKAELEKEIGFEKKRFESQRTLIPKLEHLLDVYNKLEKPAQKNALLKEILEKAVYTKHVAGKAKVSSPDTFELVIYPRLPSGEE